MIQNFVMGITDWVGHQGMLAPVYFVLIYTGANFLFIPLLPFTISGGLLFGSLAGTLAVSTATQLSATLAFLIGRYGPREWLLAKMGHHPRFKMIDEVIHDAGWKLVLLTRLSTLFPFTLLNFSYGLSKVKFRDYFFATYFGMLPGTYIWVTIGSAAGSWMGINEKGQNPAQWFLLAIACAASITAGFYIAHISRKVSHKSVAAGVA